MKSVNESMQQINNVNRCSDVTKWCSWWRVALVARSRCSQPAMRRRRTAMMPLVAATRREY